MLWVSNTMNIRALGSLPTCYNRVDCDVFFVCWYQNKYCSTVAPGCWRLYRSVIVGEKPYLCVKCLKSFVSSGVLKAHIRTHGGVKEHICSLCNMMFTTNGSMKRHMTTHSEVHFGSFCCLLVSGVAIHFSVLLFTHTHDVLLHLLTTMVFFGYIEADFYIQMPSCR